MSEDESTRERTRPLLLRENIADVADSVHEQPLTLTRHLSQELDISGTSLMWILLKFVAIKPYKVQLVQQLKPINPLTFVRE